MILVKNFASLLIFFLKKSIVNTILHIGMPKTGTTTLQSTFSANAELLSRFGVCYPALLSSSPNNHRILAFYAMNPSSYPRHMNAFKDVDISRRLIAEFRDNLIARLETIGNASKLVLSAESLYTRIRWHKRRHFSEFISSLGGGLAISAYLRSPAKSYLSLCQQQLKASQKIKPIAPSRYRQVLQSYQDTFPSSAITLVPYERQFLIGQDIVTDFCRRFLSDTHLDHSLLARAEDRNISLSGESMAMLMLYRRTFWPRHDDHHTRGSKKIIALLRQADRQFGASRPLLRDEVRRELENLASKDLHWLRLERGVVFDDVDYDRLRSPAFTLPLKRQPKCLSEIIELDRSKIMQIVDYLGATRFFGKSSTRIEWLKMVRSLDVAEI